MTPLALHILIHCSCFYYNPIPNWDYPAQSETIQDFLNQGIIIRYKDFDGGCYKLTQLGEAWLEMILNTPMPFIESKIIDPRTGEGVFNHD
jgi:hypothetical protein